jgi:hypothetical protein
MEVDKRTNYFDRQFLRAKDFQAEQGYNIHRRRLHNQLMHTSGIAGEDQMSIEHSLEQNTLTVQPGTALDDEGREIVLLNAETLHLDKELDITGEGTYALYVKYDEQLTDASPDPGLNGFPTRVQEIPRLKFQKLTDPPSFPPLTLAKFVVDQEKRLKAAPDVDVRTFVGTKMGFTGAFDALTAKSLTLREPGAITSPMWQVRLSLSEQSKDVAAGADLFDTPKEFDTAGGSVMMFATVSVRPKPPDNVDPGKPFVIGIDIEIDGRKVNFGEATPTVPGGATKPTAGVSFTTHATISTTRWISPIDKGQHKLKLRAKANTTLTECDFYNVTIVEMPFTGRP